MSLRRQRDALRALIAEAAPLLQSGTVGLPRPPVTSCSRFRLLTERLLKTHLIIYILSHFRPSCFSSRIISNSQGCCNKSPSCGPSYVSACGLATV